jgi:protein gp37
MGDKTAIEWTEATWNPVTGCSKISPGCTHCYAEAVSLRFRTSTLPWTRANEAANVRVHPERLLQPMKWREPRLVFVNSMSDLFHERIPVSFVDAIVEVMEKAKHHTFQILTKRPERARDLFASGVVRRLSDNIWLGVSIENSRFNKRSEILQEIPAAVRFISAEPLLGSLIDPGIKGDRLALKGIDWVIVGGESGFGARPMKLTWARELRDACRAERIAFFFKQWGGRTAKSGGRTLDDQIYDEMPVHATKPKTQNALFRNLFSKLSVTFRVLFNEDIDEFCGDLLAMGVLEVGL